MILYIGNKRLSLLNSWQFVIFFPIFCTVLSQLPAFIEGGAGRVLLLSWILPVVHIICTKALFFSKEMMIPLLCYILWSLFLFIMEAISTNEYLNIPNQTNFFMSLMIMYISYFFSLKVSEEDFSSSISTAALISGIIFSVGIYEFAFKTNFDITNIGYAYTSKNSAATILFSCSLVVFELFKPRNTLLVIGKLFFLFFVTILIFMMKSRATLICYFFVWFVYIGLMKNKRVRFYSLLFSLLLFISLLLLPNLLDVFINNIFLNGSEANDFDSVSSGRYEMMLEFPQLFSEHPFFGRGYYFIESFPLATITQVGIIGTLVISCFFIWLIRFTLSSADISSKVDRVAFILLFTFLINGLFEEQSPFGPGAKTFFLWIFIGYLLSRKTHSS